MVAANARLFGLVAVGTTVIVLMSYGAEFPPPLRETGGNGDGRSHLGSGRQFLGMRFVVAHADEAEPPLPLDHDIQQFMRRVRRVLPEIAAMRSSEDWSRGVMVARRL